MPITRRNFTKALSFAAVAAVLPASAAEERLPIAFSTLGCPAWPWDKILDYASAHNFAAIELRGLEGNLDLPTHAVFAQSRLAQTKREIRAHDLRIACVSSSARMGESTPAVRTEQLSDARRFIELAAELDAPYVRVFGKGSGDASVAPTDELKENVAKGLKELSEFAGSHNVTVILESHDNLVTSPVLLDILHRAAADHVALLWDAHHTFASGKEEPEFSVSQLGKWIRHTHLKDSVVDSNDKNKDRKYVLTGRGDVPVQRQVAALQKLGYQGFYCFEWEKVWHPDLADPEIAISDYARVMTRYLLGGK